MPTCLHLPLRAGISPMFLDFNLMQSRKGSEYLSGSTYARDS